MRAPPPAPIQSSVAEHATPIGLGDGLRQSKQAFGTVSVAEAHTVLCRHRHDDLEKRNSDFAFPNPDFDFPNPTSTARAVSLASDTNLLQGI